VASLAAFSGVAGAATAESVSCNADRLIAAIVRANAAGGAQLTLAARCTYTLTATQGTDGLPVITQPISIDGQGATIVRAANAANFRILNVGTGGDLTLQNLTITGGVAPNTDGGGGLLVQSGGRAILRNTTVAYNRSTAAGGGIANYGITTVLGQDDGSSTSSGTNSSAPDNAPADKPAQAPSSGQGSGSTMTAGTGQVLGKVDNNSSQTGGGGIYNEGYLTTNNVEVSYNHSGVEGGGLSDLATSVLANTRVDNNTAGAGGGGISTVLGAITKLTDGSVSNNTAGTSGGGILSVAGAAVYVQGSKVNRNTANGSDGGGGILTFTLPLGGGPAFAVIEDSEVNDNTATGGNGGGIANRLSTVVLRRSRVSLNKAIGTASQGGGISNSSGRVDLTATQVTENSATVTAGGIFTSDPLVTADQRSVIVANRPNNCTGSSFAVPNCFG
jgi:predicted outer membrane repeat protein